MFVAVISDFMDWVVVKDVLVHAVNANKIRITKAIIIFFMFNSYKRHLLINYGVFFVSCLKYPKFLQLLYIFLKTK